MMNKNLEEKLRKKVKLLVEDILNESDSGSTSRYKTQQWLKSFLNSTGVEYTLMRDTLILQDDMYRVELKVVGGSKLSNQANYPDDNDEY